MIALRGGTKQTLASGRSREPADSKKRSMDHTARQPSAAGNHLASYAVKGGFAFLDQGLFAASNFFVNVLMARWLPPSQYGVFSVAFSLFLVLGTFHTAFLIEPMMVFGSSKYRVSFPDYPGFL